MHKKDLVEGFPGMQRSWQIIESPKLPSQEPYNTQLNSGCLGILHKNLMPALHFRIELVLYMEHLEPIEN